MTIKTVLVSYGGYFLNHGTNTETRFTYSA
jgi:hypothetical protein